MNNRILLLSILAFVTTISCMSYILLKQNDDTTRITANITVTEVVNAEVETLKKKLDIPPNYKIVKSVEGEYNFASEGGHISSITAEDTYEEVVEAAWEYYEYSKKKNKIKELKKKGQYYKIIQE